MAIEVAGPGGAEWRVRRTWVELRRPRWRGPDTSGLDLPSVDVGGDDLGIVGVVLAVIGIVVLAVLVIVIGVPLLVFGAELIAVLLVAAGGLLGRLVLRRPWRIVATTPGGRSVEREVAGWRDSREAMRELAAELRDGRAGRDAVGAGPAHPAAARPAVAMPDVPGMAEAQRAAVGLRAWGALALALVWLGGVGSGLALLLALPTLRMQPRSTTSTVVGWLAVVLAVAGLLLTLLVVVGLLAEPGRLG